MRSLIPLKIFFSVKRNRRGKFHGMDITISFMDLLGLSSPPLQEMERVQRRAMKMI